MKFFSYIHICIYSDENFQLVRVYRTVSIGTRFIKVFGKGTYLDFCGISFGKRMIFNVLVLYMKSFILTII